MARGRLGILGKGCAIVILTILGSVLAGVVSAEIGNLQRAGTNAGTTAAIYSDITAAEAEAMLQTDPNLVLLDVRTPTEFSSGHIRGARCIPLSALKARVGVGALDKSKGIVVYSESGVESEEASRILAESGFGRVYNLRGGIVGVEKGRGGSFGSRRGEGSGNGKARGSLKIRSLRYGFREACVR